MKPLTLNNRKIGKRGEAYYFSISKEFIKSNVLSREKRYKLIIEEETIQPVLQNTLLPSNLEINALELKLNEFTDPKYDNINLDIPDHLLPEILQKTRDLIEKIRKFRFLEEEKLNGKQN